MQQIITVEQISNAIPKLDKWIPLYTELQKLFVNCDPTNHDDFQKKFNRFYQVRRGAGWRASFYSLMQEARTAQFSFEAVLKRLYLETGRVEASFASKLVATVDPNNPVIDRRVLENLKLKLPPRHDGDRLGKTVEVHRAIGRRFDAVLTSPVGAHLIAEFDSRFPSINITPYKMLDLVLWKATATD